MMLYDKINFSLSVQFYTLMINLAILNTVGLQQSTNLVGYCCHRCSSLTPVPNQIHALRIIEQYYRRLLLQQQPSIVLLNNLECNGNPFFMNIMRIAIPSRSLVKKHNKYDVHIEIGLWSISMSSCSLNQPRSTFH